MAFSVSVFTRNIVGNTYKEFFSGDGFSTGEMTGFVLLLWLVIVTLTYFFQVRYNHRLRRLVESSSYEKDWNVAEITRYAWVFKARNQVEEKLLGQLRLFNRIFILTFPSVFIVWLAVLVKYL